MNGALVETMSSASNGDETLSEERLFDLLGNERRRSCLQCLAAVEGAIPVQELATQVAARVSDDGASPDDIRDSVYISLCQNHLPKLDDAGVVDYDPAEKTAGPGQSFPVVERHLQVDTGGAPGGETMRYYFLLSVLTVFVLGAGTLAAPVALSYGVQALIVVHAVAVLVIGRRLA